MQTKLTLRMEKELIEKAKIFSNASGKSLSQMVSDYFRMLNTGGEPEEEFTISKKVNSIKGILKGHPELNEDDYKKHLEDNHLK